MLYQKGQVVILGGMRFPVLRSMHDSDDKLVLGFNNDKELDHIWKSIPAYYRATMGTCIEIFPQEHHKFIQVGATNLEAVRLLRRD